MTLQHAVQELWGEPHIYDQHVSWFDPHLPCNKYWVFPNRPNSVIVFPLFPLLMMPNESCKGKDEHRKNSRNFSDVSKPFNSTVIDRWTILISIYRGKVTSWVDKQLRTGLPFQVSMNSSPRLLEKMSGSCNCPAQQPWYAADMPNGGGLSGLISNFSWHPDGE